MGFGIPGRYIFQLIGIFLEFPFDINTVKGNGIKLITRLRRKGEINSPPLYLTRRSRMEIPYLYRIL